MCTATVVQAGAAAVTAAAVLNCRYAFTVHGLWPERNDHTWPQYCDPGSELDEDAIEDLLPEMEEVWPSWSSDDATFWSHEWTRHGTCAERVVGGQHAFFSAVLKLHRKLNIQVRGRTATGIAGVHLSLACGWPGPGASLSCRCRCCRDVSVWHMTPAALTALLLRCCKHPALPLVLLFLSTSGCPGICWHSAVQHTRVPSAAVEGCD